MKGLPGKLGASRKRAIFGIVAGCVVALALIWVKSNLYDPFAEEFDEISVFVTEDADFVVFSPDFPTLVKGLEDRPFISQLDRSKNFRRFLASDLVKSTDISPGCGRPTPACAILTPNCLSISRRWAISRAQESSSPVSSQRCRVANLPLSRRSSLSPTWR